MTAKTEASVDPLSTIDSQVPQSAASEVDHTKLKISFHGRIIDHLGIQMYQSPVAAIAEIISNSWDAEAEQVDVLLPDSLGPTATFTISDNGNGMTFNQCQERFLAVGRNRRVNEADVTIEKQRPILGRKGIGKFAGFGIAKIIHVATISKETGERTVFQLDLDLLRAGEYIETDGVLDVIEYLGPDETRKGQHSTTITLKKLSLGKTPNSAQFSKSMARRFALRNQLQDFAVTVEGSPLVDPEDVAELDMLFPRDYTPEKLTEHGIEVDGEWAKETLGDGNPILWRIAFYKKPIGDEDLRGISVFAHVKLAQRPFEFNVIGASGQHGLQYMAGRVRADYIDKFTDDLIAPERQRINWTVAETGPLLAWGQGRVKELLSLWRDKRGANKMAAIKLRLVPFAARLDRMQAHERRVIEGALRKLAGISSLDEDDFISLSQSLILAWEGGRLRELIDEIGQSETLDADDLLKILVEAKVLTSLHTAEAVKARIELIVGLNERIKKQQLENAVRDYIAENPWLIDHEWETFQVEKSIENVCKAAAEEAKLDKLEDWDKRIDLVLSSGRQLLVLEFMKPGLTVDRDHLDRFEFYVQSIQTQLEANTGSRFKSVSGLLVCDKLSQNPVTMKKLASLAAQGMQALDWQSLLSRAASRWKEFLVVLVQRAPEDERLTDLAQELGYKVASPLKE
ncbi:MAG: ATP-binding protein [Acidobacteriota bacterium]